MNFKIEDLTIIVTCFKEGDLLLKALESIENQSLKGFEIIIVNDCSTDEKTNLICEQLKSQDGYSVIIRPENGGLSAARNTAFENMKGKFAIPLDADDTLPADCVENIFSILTQHPDIDMIFGNYTIINANLEIDEINCSVISNDQNQLDNFKLAANWVLLGTSPCSKNIWNRVQGYSLKYSNTNQDVDFWRRIVMSGCNGYYINKVIYNWFKFDSGMNSNVSEENYLPLRIDSLPFYDKYNPDYGIEIRNYIYRYYSSRLMYNELKEFVRINNHFFSIKDKMKVALMRNKMFYKFLRKTNNILKK